MKTIRRINCAKIEDISGFYDVIAKKLSFPEWFGRNLDALYDLLGDVGRDTKLVIRGFDGFAEKLGEKGEALKGVLEDAAKENPCLEVVFK
ncbi:MAG: barstar family protein [Clostridia bacterium]|nr:barstar family protein [Clostridia bacterium]MBO7659594.1 barstar family protein [Clostridia bacterium]MBP5665227.1 barstar family protein [Clostridia bacterium]MBP5766893.1 barstar family protein [Clostridia bacterium]